MTYELKPLNVGGILDQAILILKDNFGLYLKIMLCLQLPVAIVINFIITDKLPVPSSHPTPEEMAALLQAQVAFLTGSLMPIVVLMALIVAPITSATLVDATARVYLGNPAGVRRAYLTGFRRALPLIWTGSLMYLFIFGGFFLCVLPGIVLTFWLALAPTITVLEGVSGFAALRRSMSLMRSAPDWVEHYLAFFLLTFLILIINGGIGAGSGFILERHLAGIIGTLLQAVTVPFGSIVMVVFYYSCRCRVENFDLVQLANEVAAAPTTPLKSLEQG